MLTAEGDIEAFLSAFEKMAAVAAWPQAQWVSILGPCLIGPAQVVLQLMPAGDASNSDQDKEAILDRYDVLEEMHWACFWTIHYMPRDHPCALIMDLKEAATQWLMLTNKSEHMLVNKIELEQVYLAIPMGLQSRLSRSQPPSLAEAA